MNTRLEQLSPAPTADTIAFNIGRIVIGSPYELPSNKSFYTFWVILDNVLLLLTACIFWQALRHKKWQKNDQPVTRSKHIVDWIIIIFDLLISMGILVLPSLAGSTWNSLLYLRPDFSIPLVVISVCLGGIGVIKVVKSI